MANLKDLIVNGVSRFLSPIFGTNGKFTDSVTIDGNTTIGGNLTISGTTTLSADPTENMQAATKNYVDTHSGGGGGDAGNAKVFYGTCDTAGGTAAKAVTSTGFVESDMVEGVTLIVKFDNANATNTAITLTVNEIAATTKSVKKNYYASTSANGLRDLTYAAEIGAGTAIPFIYNGTYWVISGVDVNIDTMTHTTQSNNYLKNGTAYEDNSAGYFLGYTIFGFDKNGKALAISKPTPTTTSYSASRSTTRVYCSVGFDYTQGLRRFAGNSNFEAGADMNISPRLNEAAVDLRYSDNCVLSSGTSHQLGMINLEPIYLRGTIGSDGLFYLAPIQVTYSNTTYKRVWVQPSDGNGTRLSTNPFDTSHVYWFIGYPYYNSSYPNNSYQLDLLSQGGLYYYDGTNLKPYSNTLVQDTAVSSINGTIDTNVAYVYSSNSPIITNLGFSKGVPIGKTCTIHVYNCGSTESPGTYSSSTGYVCIPSTLDASSHSNGSSTNNYVWVNGEKIHGGGSSSLTDKYFRIPSSGMLTITVFYSEFMVIDSKQHRTIINVNTTAEASNP